MENSNKKPVNILIGANIRRYRELCGYTREQFAEKIDLTPRFISNIEVGSVGVSPSTIIKICEVLGISSDRILWNTESTLSLDERVKHLDEKYITFLHSILLKQIELIESFKEEQRNSTE